MENENKNKAITFDYKTVRIRRDMEAILTDAYENLGYEVTNTQMAEGSLNYANVSFKRNRKIKNKSELLKLQEKIDYTLNNIENNHKQKKKAGLIESVVTGIIGTLTLGGGMSMIMCLNGLGYLIGGIAVGIVGIGICSIAVLVYNKIHNKKLSRLEPIYQSELDNLSDLCEKATALTKND